MIKFKRKLTVTAAASQLDIAKNQLGHVAKHYFAVKGNPVTVSYTVAEEVFTLELAVGPQLLEMLGVELLSFTSASGATVAYVGG